MRLTDEQIGEAMDAVTEALHVDGLTVDVSSVRLGDGVRFDINMESPDQEEAR